MIDVQSEVIKIYQNVSLFVPPDFMQVKNFPSHLKQELANLHDQEEKETKQREIDRCTCKVCYSMRQAGLQWSWPLYMSFLFYRLRFVDIPSGFPQ